MSKYSDLRGSTGPGRSTFMSAATARTVRVEHAAPAGPTSAWQAAWQGVAATVRSWRHNREARRGLAGMDARSLRDIGVSPEMADYEIHRAFWHPVRDLRS